MSQTGKFRKKARKMEELQERYAYSILASKVLLGLALGCFVAMPSGVAYAEEPANPTTEIAVKGGQKIEPADGTYNIYAQYVKDDLGVNRFDKFVLENGNRADMFFNKQGETDYVANLVNLVNSQITINGVLNAVKNGKIDGNLYFLSPEGIAIGAQGVINAGSFTGMVVDKDAFSEFYEGTENRKKATGDQQQGEEFNLDAVKGLTTGGTIDVSGHINTHSGIFLGAGVINIKDGAQLKSVSNIQFEDIVNSSIAQQVPANLTGTIGAGGDIVLTAANSVRVDDSGLPELKAVKKKNEQGQETDEYVLENWDKWEAGWLEELAAATQEAAIDNQGKLITEKELKLTAKADTSYKVGAIFKYLQDQQVKDLVQNEIHKSIAKKAGLKTGLWLFLKATNSEAAEMAEPQTEEWTRWIDVFLTGIMQGTGNRTNTANISLGGEISAASLTAEATANLTMDVDASVMARAYTNVKGKNTADIEVKEGLVLNNDIGNITLNAAANTDISAAARGLNVKRADGDTTTKLPSVYGAVAIVNTESGANVKVDKALTASGDFKATADMKEKMNVVASSAMNEDTGTVSAGVAYVDDKTDATVTLNKDITAKTITADAQNRVQKDLLTVNNTLGVISGQVFKNDTKPVELKPLDESKKNTLNKYLDKLVDFGDGLVGKLKQYGDAGATVGVFNQENNSKVVVNSALKATGGDLKLNAETVIGDMGKDAENNPVPIGGFHMNVVSSMTHAKSDGSANNGALINAGVLVDDVRNNAVVQVAAPAKSLQATGNVDIHAQAHMDYAPEAEGLYNVKTAWEDVKESFKAIKDMVTDDVKNVFEGIGDSFEKVDWSNLSSIPTSFTQGEKLTQAIAKIKQDGQIAAKTKERFLTTVDKAVNLTHPSSYTHYHVRTESKNTTGNFTATGSVQVDTLANNAAVLIGEGTQLHADGNTSLKADSGTYTVSLTGKGGEYATLDQAGKVGVGASVAYQEIGGTGLVMVGKNALIEGQKVDINADQTMKQVDIVYSSGKADTLNIGGMVNIVKGAGNSIVAIDDEAVINATAAEGAIKLHADNSTTINAITGGLTLGGKNATGAVGIGVNWVDYTTNNIVQVADNGQGVTKSAEADTDTEEQKAAKRTGNRSVFARDLAKQIGAAKDDFFGAATAGNAARKAWQANSFEAQAVTTGTINSIGAEIAGTTASDTSFFDKGSNLIENIGKKRDKFNNWLQGNKLTKAIQGSNGSNSTSANVGGTGGFKLSAAGSAAINKGNSDTAATVSGIEIKKNSAADLASVTVKAKDDMFIGAFAGGAAFNALKQNNSPAVAIGGAVGYAKQNRTVDSLLLNAQVEGADTLTNQAEKAGTEVAAGLSLAVNTSSGMNLTASGSVSYNDVHNQVRALQIGTEVNKNYTGSTKTAVENKALASDWQIAGGLSANWTGSDGTSANLGGAVTISDLSNDVVSMISGGAYKQADTLNMEAAKSINQINAAVAGSKSGGKTALGLDGAVAYNEVDNKVRTVIRNGSNIEANGTVTLVAHDKAEDKTASKADLQAKGIDVDHMIESYISQDAKKTIANKDVVDSANDKEINATTDNAGIAVPGSSLAVNVAAGINISGNGAGAGVGIDEIKTDLSVDIQGATLKAAAIDAGTTNHTKIVGVAAGASIGSEYFGGAGAVSWHNVTNNNTVNITDSNLTADTVNGVSSNESSIVSVAGQFNQSSNVGAGMTLANNDMNNTSGVYLKGGKVQGVTDDKLENLTLAAHNDTYVLAVGAGVGVSGLVSLNGSVAINEGSNSSEAIISKGTTGTEIANVKAVNVTADNTTSKTTIAGGLNYNTENAIAGAGGAVAYANIGVKDKTEKTQALIQDAAITTQAGSTIEAAAEDTSKATSVGVGVGLEGMVNLQGGVARTNVHKDVNAGMENTSVDEGKETANADVKIKAKSTVNNKTAGSALSTAITGLVSGGVGLSFNDVNQNTKAYYSYRNTRPAYASRVTNLAINATADNKLLGVGIGASVASTFAIGGSYSYNYIRGNTTAEMNQVNVISAQNIGVVSQSDDAISSIAGAIAAGAGGAAGVSVANNQLTGDTVSEVTGSRVVTNTAADSDNDKKIAVNNGIKDSKTDAEGRGIISGQVSRATFVPGKLKDGRESTSLTGLVIDSSATHAISSDLLTGAGGAIGGVAGTFNENFIKGNTRASLNDTSVNEDKSQYGGSIKDTQNTTVKAADYTNIGAFEVGVAGGANVGFGATQNANNLNRAVLAESSSQSTANVKAHDFTLQALAKQGVSNLAIAGGLAVTGAAANANVISDDLTMDVQAKTNRLNLEFTNQADILADNESRVYMGTYGISVAITGASVGMGINLVDQQSTVKTTVANSTLKETEKTTSQANIKAQNKTVQEASLVSGAAAGMGLGIVGTFNHSKLTSDVGVDISGSTLEAGQIKVNSHDIIWSDQNTGSVGGGLLGGAGVNSTVNTVADKSHVNISGNSLLTAKDTVEVKADIVRDIDTSMINVSLGGVSVGVNHMNTSVNESLKADTALQDKISKANALDKDNTSSFVGLTSAERQQARARTAFKIDTAVTGESLGSQLSVSGSAIKAGSTLSLDAEEKNRLNLWTVGTSVGAGSFVVTNSEATLKNATAVSLDGASLTGSRVDVTANTTDNPRDDDSAGKTGLYTQGAVGNLGVLGITAITSQAKLTGSTTVNVKNTDITSTGDVNINAKSGVTANTNVNGVTAGVATVNAIDTGITNTSVLAVNFENNSGTHTIKSTKADGKINVNAVNTGNFTANSTGISAGLLAAGGNKTYAKDNSTSQINITGSNYAFAADALSFQAANAPKLKVDIDNHAVGVATGMASYATAEVNSSALINADDNNAFQAGSVYFGAQVGKEKEITAASRLRSVAVAGMAIPGYSGDDSLVSTKTNAAINIGKENYKFTDSENKEKRAALTIAAVNLASRQNDVSNVTVSAIKFAAGAITGTTRAEDTASVNAGGGDVYKLLLGAMVDSYTDSYVRGSGGGIADYGNTAKAITYFDNAASANIYGKWDVTDELQVAAEQEDGMDIQAFSGSGGIYQGGGLYTNLDIGSKGRITSANIGNNADIQANKVYVGAENYLNTRKNNKYGKRLDMTAISFYGMSVLESKDVIKKGTQVNIGDNAKVTTVGTQEYEVTNKDVLNNYAEGLNGGLTQTIVTQSRTDYTSANKVTLGQGAVLRNTGGYDKGGITLAAYDDIDSTVHAEGQVRGLAGAGPTAITEHNIKRTNQVNVKGTIKSQKDINLYAGADRNGNLSNVKQLSIADARNDTLIPMGWRRELDMENQRNNTVQVEAGAVGEALRNINIKAVNGQENILKQASYHTIYGGKGGDKEAIPVVETSDGSGRIDKLVTSATNYAQVDGSLLAGYQDKLYVTITGQVVPQSYLGHHDVKDAKDATILESHDVTAAGGDAAYTISIVDDEGRHYTELEQATKQYSSSYASILTSRWTELKKLLNSYSGKDGKGGDGQTAIAYAGYAAELELLEAKMKNLGLLEETEVNGKKVNIPVTSGYDIPIVALPELLEASGGTINVDSSNFYGTGSVVAKTNPEVKVENQSNAYLVVNDVLLRDKGEGIIYRDNLIASDAAGKAQIKELNGNKNYDVAYSKLKSVTGDGPAVNITSDNASISGITLTDRVTKGETTDTVTGTYDGVGAIEIAGHVNGGIGDVNITNRNRNGDIIINGSDSKATGVDGRTIRLTATSGSVTQSYTKGVVHIGSTPEDVYKNLNDTAIDGIKNNDWGNTYTATKHTEKTVEGTTARNESVATAGKAGRIAGNAIFIAADAINVNGILQSGYGKYAALVTEEQVAAAKTAAANKDFSKSKLYEGHRIYKVNEGGTSWDNKDADGSLKYTVQVYYDPDNDTLLTEDVDAQGGKVYLTGRIISTTGGQIFAADGGADIQIENQSATAMQLGKILNNDINGEVVLTTSSLENGKEVLTRHSYTTNKVTTTKGYMGANPEETSDTTNVGRSYSFTPVANSRYNWTVGSESTTTTHYYYRDTKIFNADVFSFESDSSKVSKTEYPAETKPLPNGIFVSQGNGSDYQVVADNVILSDQDRLNFNADSTNYVLWKNYYYNWDRKKGSMQTYVSSIKADNPIAIKFIGQDDGTINVQSKGGITLSGNIRNNNDAGTIDIHSAQGGIMGNAGVSITGNKVNLSAQKDIANINIGTLNREKAVQLQANTQDGNIGITVNGDVEVSTVKAQAAASVAGNNNITLNASGNILQGTGDGLIGQRIDLTSRAGAIGTAGQMLKVRAGQQALNDDPRSASISATAQKDIFLKQNNADESTGGDMRIGIVRSIAGDVTLNNAGGSFVDALPYNGDETSDETAARIQRWIDAGMIAGPDRNNAYIRKLERNVADYEEMVRKNFADYLVMKENQAGLTEENQKIYAKLDAEYGAYANSDAYLSHLAADAGSDYAKLKAEAENPTYKWTQDELLYALRSEIVNKEVGSTDSRDKVANVSGRNITLVGENVGSNLKPQNIAYEQLANGYVDPNDPSKTNIYYLKILANADAVDVIHRQDGQGKDYLEVTGMAPLGIHATGVINAQAVGNEAEDISLSARKAAEDGEASVLKLGTIQADNGLVRIMGKAGLENALDDANTANVIAKGEVLLEGGVGAVGSEAKAINVQAGGDLSARSNANIYIKNVGENALSVGSVYTPDTLKLWSAKGLVGSTANLEGTIPYINAQHLFLDATNNGVGSDLGTPDRPLYILSNGVDIQAAGHSAQFQGVEHAKNSMVLNHVELTDDLWLHTPGTLAIANVVYAGDTMVLSADKGIVMADQEEEATAASYLDAGTSISLASQTGDLGAKSNVLRLLNSGVSVTAAGVNGYLLGLERPALHTVGMNLGNIGTETAPGFSGDLWVKSQGALTTSGIVHVKGNLELLADNNTLKSQKDWIAGGDIHAKGNDVELKDDVKAGGKVTVEGQNINLVGNTNADHDLTLTATGAIKSVGNWTAGNDMTVAGTNIDLNGNIAATHNLDMTAAGDITSVGKWTAGNDLTVSGRNITADGQLSADKDVNLTAAAQVNVKDKVTAGNDVTVKAVDIQLAGEARGNNITLSATNIDLNGTMTATQDLGVTAIGDITSAGNWAAGNDMTVAGTNLDLNGAITATHNLDMTASGDITSAGNWTAGNDMTVAGTNIDLNGNIAATQNLDMTATGDITSVGNWTAGNDLTVSGRNITADGQLSADKDVNLTASAQVNVKDKVTAGNDVTVKAVDIQLAGEARGNNITLSATNINLNGTMTATQDLGVKAAGDITSVGNWTAGNDMTVAGTNLDLNGAITTTHNLDMTATGDITSVGNWTAGNDLTVSGRNITADGQLSADKDVNLTAAAQANVKDKVAAGNDVNVKAVAVQLEGEARGNNITLSATNIDLNGTMTATQDLDVMAAGDITSAGNWTAGKDMTVAGTNIDLNGAITATQDLGVTAAGDITSVGNWTAGNDMTVAGTNIDLNGNIAATQNLDMTATGDITSVGNWTAGNDLTVSGRNITADGQLSADKDVKLTAAAQANVKGKVAAGNDVTVKAADIQLEGEARGNNITLSATNINLNGAMTASHNLDMTATGDITSVGNWTAGNDLMVAGTNIDLNGNIAATQNLDMTAAGNITSAGNWTVDGNLTVRGDNIETAGDIAAGSRLEFTAAGYIAGNGNLQAGTDVVNSANDIMIIGGIAAGNNASLLTSNGDVVVSKDVVVNQSVTAVTNNGSFVVFGKVNAIQGDATLITGFDSFHADDDGSILVTGGINAGQDVAMYSRNADIIVAEFSDNPEANVITAGRDINIKTIDAGDIAVLGALHSGRNTSALVEGNRGDIEIFDTITAGAGVDLTVQSDGHIFVNFDFDSNGTAENMEIHAGTDVTAHTQSGGILIGRTIIADQGEIKLLSESGSIAVTGKTNALEGNILALTGQGDIVIGDTLDHFEESVTARNNVSLLTNSGTVYIFGKTVAQNGDVSLKAGKDVYEPGKSNFIIEDNGVVEAGHDIFLTGRNGDIFMADYLQAKGGIKAYAEEQGNISFATDITVNGDIGLTTDKGDITVGQNVNSLQGNVDIAAKTGNITIEKDLFAENGAIRAYSGKGEIHIGDQGPHDDVILARTNIDLETQEGRITVQGRTRSVEGDIKVSAAVPEYQQGKDSIILEQNGEVVSGGAITINSGNGDFHVTDRVQAEESLYTNVIGKGSMYYDTDIEVRNDIKTAVEEGTIYVGANVKAGNDVDMSSGIGNIYVGHSIDAKAGNINLNVERGNIDVGDNDAETETITAANDVNIAAKVGKITVYGKTSTRNGDITLKAGSENYIAGDSGRNIIIDHNGLVDSARDVKLIATNGDLHVTDNVLSQRNIAAQVLEQGGLYFDRDIDLKGDLVAGTENGDIVARDVQATGDIRITQKKGDIRINLADATHVFLQMEDNTEASQVNTIRANANGDELMDVTLTGSYLNVGTLENKGGTDTFQVSLAAPDGQAFIEKLNIGQLRSDTGTFIPKVWTRQGDMYVDKGQLQMADVMAADKFRFANAMVDAAVYGRIPTHDGEQLVYWNDAAKAYQMQRPFNLFADGGMITDRAVLVDSHDWRRLYSRKYSETYSVVDRMRDYLMRKNHYYSAGALIPYTPPMTYVRVESAGNTVNTVQADNASEQEITVE